MQGDWGTQFGMLTQHMSELRPGGLADVGQEDISDLLVLYKCAHRKTSHQGSVLLKAHHHHHRCHTSNGLQRWGLL